MLLAQEDPDFRDRFVLGDDHESPARQVDSKAVHLLRSAYEVTVLDEKVIVFSTVNKHKISLSPSSSMVLDLMDGKRSNEDIVTVLQAAYPDAIDAVKEDVGKTIAFLIEQGIVIQI